MQDKKGSPRECVATNVFPACRKQISNKHIPSEKIEIPLTFWRFQARSRLRKCAEYSKNQERIFIKNDIVDVLMNFSPEHYDGNVWFLVTKAKNGSKRLWKRKWAELKDKIALTPGSALTATYPVTQVGYVSDDTTWKQYYTTPKTLCYCVCLDPAAPGTEIWVERAPHPYAATAATAAAAATPAVAALSTPTMLTLKSPQLSTMPSPTIDVGQLLPPQQPPLLAVPKQEEVEPREEQMAMINNSRHHHHHHRRRHHNHSHLPGDDAASSESHSLAAAVVKEKINYETMLLQQQQQMAPPPSQMSQQYQMQMQTVQPMMSVPPPPLPLPPPATSVATTADGQIRESPYFLNLPDDPIPFDDIDPLLAEMCYGEDDDDVVVESGYPFRGV